MSIDEQSSDEFKIILRHSAMRRRSKGLSVAGCCQEREDNRPIRATACNDDVIAPWSSDSAHMVLFLTSKSFPL